MKGRKYIAGAPLKAGGGHNSTMKKEMEANKYPEPGMKKYGSNTMSPCSKAGKVNDYGK